MTALLVPALLCFFLLSGCDNETSTSPSQPAPRRELSATIVSPIKLEGQPLLSKPLEAKLVEMPNDLLPIWRKFAPARPTLAIFGGDPYLQPIPEELRQSAKDLINSASDTELSARSSAYNPDPTFLPGMTLSAALEAGLFSEIIWVFPSQHPVNSLDVTVFRQQLIESGIASETEAAGLSLQNGTLSGNLRGTPFRMIHPQALPRIEEPLLLHIDPGFLQPLYKGEIKTPIYQLMTQILASIKEKGWKAAAVTICRPTPDAGLPLATRFTATDLAEMLLTPSVLNEAMPQQWDLRSRALYLENFMQKDEILHLYREMEQEDFADPSIKYALYNILRQMNKPEEALAALSQAADLDPVYAREFLVLSELALQKKRPEKSLQMLQLARAALPKDPFIILRLTRMYLNLGQREEALKLVENMSVNDWSMIYYPKQRNELEGLKSLLQD